MKAGTNPDDVEAIILEEIERASNEEPSEDELLRIKNQLQFRFLAGLEQLTQSVNHEAELHLMGRKFMQALINRLLAHPPAAFTGKRLTILVNDFGAINIDVELIEAHDGDTISLANGCACCQLQDDALQQLQQLAKSETRPDHVLIEASGAGEPARRPEPPRARAHRANRAERVRDAGESPFGFIRPRLSSDEIRTAKDGGGFEDTRGEREGTVSRRSNAGAGRAAAERRKKRAFRGMMTAGTMARERHARNCVARENGSSRTRATHHDPVFVCPVSSETALPRCPVAGEGCGERSGAERAARRAPDGVRSNANAWCFG